MADIAFRDYERLLHKIANEGHRKLAASGVRMERDDLFQELSLVFVQAQRGFNPNKGFKFSTYLSMACHNRITRLIQRRYRKSEPPPMLSLDTTADGALVEIIPDGHETVEDTLVRAADLEGRMGKLSETTRAVVQAIEDNYEELLKCVEGVKTRVAYGRAHGFNEPSPRAVGLGIIAAAFGIGRTQMRQISDEIHRVMLSK